MTSEIDDDTRSPLAVSVLIPAAGSGSRANLDGNKLFALLHNEPVLVWTLRALLHPDAMPKGCVLREIILATRREEWTQIENCIYRACEAVAPDGTVPLQVLGGASPRIFAVPGGTTRQSSVRAALNEAGGELIAVHDAARPLVSPETFARVVQSAREHGAAIAAAPASDTVKFAFDNHSPNSSAEVESTLPRARVWLAQTPQIFRRDIFELAFEQAERDDFEGTDCASLVERLRNENGNPVARVQLVPSDAGNLKITFAEDIARAEIALSEQGK